MKLITSHDMMQNLVVPQSYNVVLSFSSICSLESELKKFRVQFEETVDAHEAEVKNLNNQITDLSRQREAALREVAELKVQLKMTEETRDSIRRDLIEANRKIREGKLVCFIMIHCANGLHSIT